MATQLYRHFDDEGRLLYVGISHSALARLVKHRKNCAPWIKRVALVRIQTFRTRDQALVAERQAIRNEKPFFNVIHNRRKAA